MWFLYLLFIISLPLQEVWNIKTFFTLKLFQVLILPLACLVFTIKAISTERLKKSPLDKWLALFLLSYISSLFVAKDFIRGGRVVLALLFMYLAYYVTINLVVTKKRLFAVLKTVVLVSVAIAFFGLCQVAGYLMGYDTGMKYSYETWMFPRLSATMEEPSSLANYLLFSFCLLVVFIMKKSYPLMKRRNTALSLLLIFIAFVLTLSKGAFIGALLLFPIVISGRKLFSRLRTNKVALACGVILFILIVYNIAKVGLAKTADFYSESEMVNSAFFNTSGGSYSQRVEFNNTAWSMFLANPILGVGPYNFTIRYDEYKPVWAVLSGNLNLIPNNIVLQLLAENGVIGFMIFFVITWKTVSFASWFLRRMPETSGEHIMLSGLLYGFLAMTIHYILSSSIYFPHYWVLLGLLIAGAQILYRSSAESIKGQQTA